MSSKHSDAPLPALPHERLPTLVCATEFEWRGVEPAFDGVDAIDASPSGFVVTRKGRRFRLFVVGVGGEAAANFIRAIQRWPTNAVIAFGYAGGANPQLRSGELVVGSTVATSASSEPPLRLVDGGFCQYAKRVRVASTARAALEPAQKRQLFEQIGGDVVDMETHALATECARLGVPIISLRAVTDAAGDSIAVEWMDIVGNGAVSKSAALRLLARKPWLLPQACKLGWNAFRANRALRDGIKSAMHWIGRWLDGEVALDDAIQRPS